MNRGNIILFDGVCNLCNRAVDFLLRHDRTGSLLFASLQSQHGERLLREAGLPKGDLDSFVFIEDNRVSMRSTAALRVMKALGGFWKLPYIFIVIPAPLRDAIYRWVARNRYRWFGKRETCRIPTDAEKARFLDS